MALADRRPLGIPVSAIPASPSFNPKTLSVSPSITSPPEDKNYDDAINPLTPEKSLSPGELSPTSRSISPDSLMNNELSSQLLKKSYSRGSTPPTSSSTPPSTQNITKKPKNTSRAPIATGISTTIPVTGEKPRPEQKNDPSLEDDVLYAIFVILYEKDPLGSGMTVKQICDILVEQHPEMANLSTKTSNLVSAKLNAYVKRVEKGENNLKYALSRDWADASPKRMVYVYRGLLADDFQAHVKKLQEMQKQDQSSRDDFSQSPKSGLSQGPRPQVNAELNLEDPLEAGKQATLAKPRRQTMFDLGITKNTFLEAPIDKSNLFVPYNSAPVTASLTESNSTNESNDSKSHELDLELEDFEVFNDDDDDDDLVSGAGDLYIDSIKKNGKRSKSLSYLSLNKKCKIMTAAAAAPRASRAPSSHSPNAAAAAAALHAAALKAISNPSSSVSSPNSLKSSCNKKWLNVIRSGFLSQDIGAPEDISLSDLDKFFA
ncbi:uncharacterized protein CANTADRAFT_24491 [Suhomyces tanzawaensis NRRL Y-17324]|uniref:GDS1 winged helix domain-containing protein n=1 Tax=Suhomyces tanzawaensis NRRL Y-17324 TaxID=984487 RepID=A0A1E4SQC7_9ASCO|nr:uncharacterized protein CANTADRAFT_24491 [Suhomyces tanzawaensis NRRL Y-17324]ODV81612.1 hypothetical protein CANTADRAFT_24491 [Suhomyces tanzawaensis NRRL Y-17324]